MYYDGEFAGGFANGKGALSFASHNAKYEGNFKDGLFAGEKEKFDSDEYLYIGMFTRGKK